MVKIGNYSRYSPRMIDAEHNAIAGRCIWQPVINAGTIGVANDESVSVAQKCHFPWFLRNFLEFEW